MEVSVYEKGLLTKEEIKKLSFDSKEEEYFFRWLQELDSKGFIKKVILQESFNLIDSVYENFNKVNKTNKIFTVDEKESGKFRTLVPHDYFIMHGLSYTPDFTIIWDESARGLFYFLEGDKIYSTPVSKYMKTRFFSNERKIEGNLEHVSTIEIKGTFAARHNSTNIKFPLLQKLMYYVKGIYVQKVMPLHKKKGLFKETFTPDDYLITKKAKKVRKISWEIKSCKEYLDKITKEKKYIDERIE